MAMTVEEMVEWYKNNSDWSNKQKYKSKIASALELLTALNPFLEKGYSLIAAAEHDVVYFGVLLEALAKADDELIKDILSYSGVFIEEGTDSLGMFV